MPKPKILLQLDPDSQPSVFDSVVAVDSDVDQLFRHGDVSVDAVEALVHGAMFTRGPEDLKSTAIFVGGSNVAAGEALLDAVTKCFFGPMRVSVMMDSNGSNTTAAAAVLAAARHVDLSTVTATVLATGPVGQRAALLLARQGAIVRGTSRRVERAEIACQSVRDTVPDAKITAHETTTSDGLAGALEGADVVINAGAAGVEIVSSQLRASLNSLKVAVDLNAVPPLGIGGIDVMDKAVEHDGAICYGAIGVGGLKMKIHKAAVRSLFETNDLVLDAEQIFAIGQALDA
ncbi:MAG: NADP-dependent methylenetetrahydromethanopterin/methylenetetrahydrofolate dehydrogenase [Pirellulales bacterium]|nr:NADP-dependent methylenetetrahydromethanopterin/methylenetetrahydrofolate dehydrogenase [Pirellulales bacterium]